MLVFTYFNPYWFEILLILTHALGIGSYRFFFMYAWYDWDSPIPIYSGCGRVTCQFHPGDDNADIYISTGQQVHLTCNRSVYGPFGATSRQMSTTWRGWKYSHQHNGIYFVPGSPSRLGNLQENIETLEN